jgi:Arc/MetJ family transcription regulator
MCTNNSINSPMRTHIDLDENLVAQVVAMGHFPTKKAAIHAALTELAKTLKRRQLLALRGNISWEGDLNQLRGTRNSNKN